MEHNIDKNSPIGAWVKTADEVFTNLTRKTSENGSFNRIDWQFFNFLKEKGSASILEAHDFLSFFENKEAINKIVERFKNDALVSIEQHKLSLTAKGEKVYQEVWEIQESIKRKALDGINETDYATTIETLAKIIENLKEYLPNEA